MKDLTTVARGQPCYLRLPEFCRRLPEYTVFAHARVGHTGGMGLKPPPVCGAPACDRCHDVYDGRFKQALYERNELDAEMLRAENQWLAWLFKQEILVVVL